MQASKRGIGGGPSYSTTSRLSVRPAQYHMYRNRDTIIIYSENGRNIFHVRAMSLSYRIRGRVPRAQINTTAIIIVSRSIRESAIKGGVFIIKCSS